MKSYYLIHNIEELNSLIKIKNLDIHNAIIKVILDYLEYHINVFIYLKDDKYENYEIEILNEYYRNGKDYIEKDLKTEIRKYKLKLLEKL